MIVKAEFTKEDLLKLILQEMGWIQKENPEITFVGSDGKPIEVYGCRLDYITSGAKPIPEPSSILFLPFDNEKFQLSIRLENVLRNIGIDCVWEAMFLTDADFLKAKNVGRKSLRELREVTDQLIGGLPKRENFRQFLMNRLAKDWAGIQTIGSLAFIKKAREFNEENASLLKHSIVSTFAELSDR